MANKDIEVINVMVNELVGKVFSRRDILSNPTEWQILCLKLKRMGIKLNRKNVIIEDKFDHSGVTITSELMLEWYNRDYSTQTPFANNVKISDLLTPYDFYAYYAKDVQVNINGQWVKLNTLDKESVLLGDGTLEVPWHMFDEKYKYAFKYRNFYYVSEDKPILKINTWEVEFYDQVELDTPHNKKIKWETSLTTRGE